MSLRRSLLITDDHDDNLATTSRYANFLTPICVPLIIIGIICLLATLIISFEKYLVKYNIKVFSIIKDYYGLISQVSKLFIYYFIGIIYYYYNESWSIGDCVYFITVTFSTVGYGDLIPSTDGSRLFTCFYILTGIIFIFSIIVDFASFVLLYASSKAKEKLYSKDYKPSSKIYQYLNVLIGPIILIFLFVAFFVHYESLDFIAAFYFGANLATCYTLLVYMHVYVLY